ncbi:FadR family transcriptional regulator [Streptomyces hoynatensis]|uniref:FadR family transcriptional regulator n=2 Tax=Streptomyces hoynatensis TaxID=1141874 RepID=A0A3A9Z6T5_9ACTN|nr:FadR family transcriptional regulator [Streptomyces hoynatensis]
MPGAAGGKRPAAALPTFPRRPARLAHAVVEVLVDRIAGGDFPPGSSLPTEPELCERFGVSRTTIREAVKSLEAKGLARARQGSGTTVTATDSWNLLDPVVLAAAVRHDDELVILDQLVGVRSALESQMAGQAAAHATEEELRGFEETLALLERQTATPELFTETDVELHERIMTASGNTLGRSIVRIVHAQARKTTLYTGMPDEAGCRAANEEHRRVVELLRARDAEGAARAMTSHIEEAWGRRRAPAAAGRGTPKPPPPGA